MGKSAGSPPPAPDYKGAAESQAASQRISQYTPYGSQVYSPDYVDPQGNMQYRSQITLDPRAQGALDSQLALSQQMGDLAQQQGQQVAQQPSYSPQQLEDQAYGAFTSRLDPQWAHNKEAFDAQMANQGLTAGGEAYDNAYRDFSNAKNDAYQQAQVGAINTIPQSLALYDEPLNRLNALRSGAQVQNPQFTPQPGANYTGAAQAAGQYGQGLYNAQVGQQNAMTQGMFGLGSAGLMALALA